jgi:opacity protein-like surface antigen
MRLFILLMVASAAFSAPSGFYIEADVAAESSKNEQYTTDVGAGASMSVGFQLNKFRLELQARESLSKLSGYESQTTTFEAAGDMRTSSKFVNLYFSGYNKTRLVSTIGLGVGQSDVDIKDVKIVTAEEDDINLKKLPSYQASYSIGYMVNKDFSYVFKYNYLHIDNDKEDEFDTKEFKTHMFSVGVRYLF